ncbi:hypothetical protein PGB90_006507 [Kerria lacca]
MPKKKFIDKKKAVTFHLVHRSQHDPLTVDENAPQRVLLPVGNTKSTKEKLKEEQLKYGIYFDDDYNYLQHLSDVNKTNVEWVQTSKTSENKNQKLHLPSSVFASTVEEEIGVLNKAAPQPTIQLDLDPDVVAAMDEDFDYDNPENILQDNFIELANISPSGSEYGSVKNDFFENNSCYSDEFDDEVENLKNVETKSRFTDFSMTSSIISRNSQLTLLDQTFEQMYVNYDDVEIGALDCDEIKGELDVDSSIFKMVADQFAKEKEQEKLVVEDINKLRIDSSDEENDNLIEIKEKEKWDCESILSTYSNIYNHPKLIEEPISKIKINKKTGIPMNNTKLTIHRLAQLDNAINRNVLSSQKSTLSNFSILDTNTYCQNDKGCQKKFAKKKIGKETAEEKKLRKKQLKEMRKERRMERKANSVAFKEEKKKLEIIMVQNKLNQRGIAL